MPPKIFDYKTLSTNTPELLDSLIKSYISSGYQPYWRQNVCADSYDGKIVYSQVMVKYEVK